MEAGREASMKALLLTAFLPLALAAQDPFKPLDLDRAAPVQSGASLRTEWIQSTNKRLELSGKAMRVATEGPEGTTAVILDATVAKARHAKPILQGKGEHAVLVKSLFGLGFTRLLVRNPQTGEQWGARIDGTKVTLE